MENNSIQENRLFSFYLKLQFPRDNKDMGVVGGREETEGVYK